MLKTVVASVAALFLTTSSFAGVSAPPFRKGEQLTYQVKWTIFSATVEMEVEKLDLRSGKAELKANAYSNFAMNRVYPFQYGLSSKMELDRGATHFEMDGFEKKEQKTLIEDFDYAQSKGTLNKKKFKNGVADQDNSKPARTYAIGDSVQDVISLTYFVRSKIAQQAGEIKTQVVFEGDLYNCTFTPSGKSTARVDGTVYPTTQYTITAISLSGEKQEAKAWVAGDAAHTLVRVEAKPKFGKLVMQLKAKNGQEEDGE